MINASMREEVTNPSSSSAAQMSLENVIDDRICELLETFGLLHLAELYRLDSPRNWEDLLSLNEHQRVTIIRLILHRPALATLDECTSVISESQQKTFYRYLRSLNMPTFLWGTGLSCSGFMTRLLCLSPVLSVAGLNHLLQVLRLEGRGSARYSLISQQCKI